MLIKYLLSLTLLFSINNAYKILVVNPKFGYSHVNYFSQISDILVDAGHNVTVLTIEMDPSIIHPGSYKANIIRYPATKKIEAHFINAISPEYFWSLKSTRSSQLKMVEKFMATFYDLSVQIFNDDELTEMIRKEKFDVGISEAVNSFMFGMFKVWDVKTTVAGLSMSLFDHAYGNFGLHFPSSYIPTFFSPFTDKMTYLERCQNLLNHLLGRYTKYMHEDRVGLQEKFDEKYGKGFIDMNKAIGDSSFILLNSSPFIDTPGPKTAKMIEVSGIGIKDTKPLDDKWDKILSLRNTTVLISFGTIAKSSFMPKDMKNGLLETIKRLRHITFIWKYETPDDGTGGKIDNLILNKWLPQSDLLNDKRLSLFITHGGLGSATEAFYRGIPVVAIPILGDQLRNVKLFERHRTGLLMNKDDLKKPELLEEKIKEIITNSEYKNNAEMISKKLKKNPINPKEILVKHVEFAAEFGSMYILDLASREMGLIKYFNLDIILPFFIISISLIVLIFIITFNFFKRHTYSKSKTE